MSWINDNLERLFCYDYRRPSGRWLKEFLVVYYSLRHYIHAVCLNNFRFFVDDNNFTLTICIRSQ